LLELGNMPPKRIVLLLLAWLRRSRGRGNGTLRSHECCKNNKKNLPTLREGINAAKTEKQ